MPWLEKGAPNPVGVASADGPHFERFSRKNANLVYLTKVKLNAVSVELLKCSLLFIQIHETKFLRLILGFNEVNISDIFIRTAEF